MLLSPSNEHLKLTDVPDALSKNIVEWAGEKYVRRAFLEKFKTKVTNGQSDDSNSVQPPLPGI